MPASPLAYRKSMPYALGWESMWIRPTVFDCVKVEDATILITAEPVHR